jgi:hypothetical protein
MPMTMMTRTIRTICRTAARQLAPLLAVAPIVAACGGTAPPPPAATVGGGVDPALAATLAALPTVPPPTTAALPGGAPAFMPTVPPPGGGAVGPAPEGPTVPPPVDADGDRPVTTVPPPGAATPDGRLGEATTVDGVTVQATLRDLGGDPPVWALDLAVRVETPPTLHWRLATAADAAAGRGGGDVVQAALADATGAQRALIAHGDVILSPAARGLLRADCPPTSGVAAWDRGVGPHPRRLPPGATARAWLLLDDPGMSLADAQARGLRLALRLPGRRPITLALTDPVAPAPALLPTPPPPPNRGDAPLPGGGRLLEAAITPPDAGAPCPGARRVRATIGNPTDAPVPIPVLIVSLDGYRYPLPPPDEALLAPGDQRTITAFLAPLPPDAVDAPALLLALAPQRADDAPTPWTAIPIPPMATLLPDG